MASPIEDSEEQKALIDRMHWTKQCTGGTRGGATGCNRHLPLYEFSQAPREKLLPGPDGLVRKNVCRECLTRYNTDKQNERRSQILSKRQVIDALQRYRLRKADNTTTTLKELGIDVSSLSFYQSFLADNRDEFKFLEVEGFKRKMKAEIAHKLK